MGETVKPLPCILSSLILTDLEYGNDENISEEEFHKHWKDTYNSMQAATIQETATGNNNDQTENI